MPLSERAEYILSRRPKSLKSPKMFYEWQQPTGLERAWRKALANAGITGLRFHDLRHEATSRFFENGLNIMEVAAITGCKDLSMLKRYTHLRARAWPPSWGDST